MNRILILTTILSTVLRIGIFGQINDSIENNCIPRIDTLQGKDVVYLAEKMPEFLGGEVMLRKYLAENIEYPTDSLDILQTKVFVTFVIDTTGKCVNECILKPLYIGRLTPFETSILDVLRKLPEWKPGESNGVKVPVRFTIPVNIELR